MALQTRPEPMNASPHHSKIKVTLTLGQSLFVAGEYVTGKMEMECRADKGLGINIIMVELFAIEELTSRDHSATSTFMHSRRLFQGPGLPPSNSVQPHPFAGDPPLPRDYHQARRGISTFLFRFPIPSSSPSSISFGSGLACVRYEVRASVGVAWKGEKRLVTDKAEVDIVQSYEEDFGRVEPEGVVIGENGKLWTQGRVVGGVIVSGESACVELQVKNHSNKKNTGLSITLTRLLQLPGISHSEKPPLQISDTLTTVAFRGPEYTITPGAEGVASLVFDVPKFARGVKGGIREDHDEEAKITEPLFEVQCILSIKISMGIGRKDITLDLPVTVVHPSAIPELPAQEQYPPPSSYPYTSHTPELISAPHPSIPPVPFHDRAQSPFAYPALPVSPFQPYIDQGHVWFPPPPSTPNAVHALSPPIQGQQYYCPQPALVPPYMPAPRPSSAGAFAPEPHGISVQQSLPPLDFAGEQTAEPEEGKGERASRISQHLHLSSRNRSVSPQSHRFPIVASHSSPIAIPPPTTMHNLPPAPLNAGQLLTPPVQSQVVVHSPRPLLSPKQSFSNDRMAHNSLPKSVRVEELERMAEELNAQKKDLSANIPKISQDTDAYSDKTLPAPPVPTGKAKLLSPPSVPAPTRADAIFAILEGDAAHAPPTPTLAAITPSKQPRNHLSGLGNLSGLGGAESGLDALERRLLAEVGTRKLDLGEKRPDVRAVLPIGIPQPNREIEPLHDSAISSLSLAEHDSDERTQKAGKSNVSGDDREVNDRGRGQDRTEETLGRLAADQDEKREEQRKKGKKKERGRDGDARRFRKLAKGRVAAWLGEIDPDVPPLEIPPGPDIDDLFPDLLLDPTLNPSMPKDVVVSPEDTQEENVSSAPNPRSSGFVPIGTLKRDHHRPSVHKSPATGNKAEKRNVKTGDIKPSADATTRRALFPSPALPQTPKADLVVTPPSSQPVIVSGNGKLRPEGLKPHPAPISDKPHAYQPPRLPISTPRPDPEVKYDVKSARGGRGGKVTAVAAIWASAAAQQGGKMGPQAKDAEQKKYDKPPVNPKPLRTVAKSPLSTPTTSTPPEPPHLVDFSRKRSKPVIKSMSVPAVVSSSHATPTLSSTASLARVTTTSPHKSKPPIKLPPTISETPSDLGSSARPINVKPSSGELAFGQARLRDLIKKYQGQVN